MKKYVAFLVFTAFVAVMLPVCEGPIGPQGIQGEKGETGEKGQKGEKGEPGDTGEPGEKGEPGDTGEPGEKGEPGDAGKPGEKGEAGTNGLSITWKGALDKSPEKPQINWAYYNKVDKKSYIYDGKSWQILAQDGEPGQQGGNGETGGNGGSLYLVTFNANGGSFYGLNAEKKIVVEEGCPIAAPEEPYWAWNNFMGWHTQPEGSSLFNFSTPVTAPITLYAQWHFDKNLLADWLEDQSGGDGEEDPLSLKININLDDDWQELLEAIETAGKYVELDLSQCEMSGTVFNPGSGISTGKNKIVSIILPDKATEIAKGSSEATRTFNNFVNLRSLNAANLTDIGAYAFHGCSKLALTELPEGLTKINTFSFRSCSSLAIKALPSGVTEIGANAFNGCSGLVEMTLYKKVTKIGSYAFNGCANLKFFTCLAETPPSLGSNDFSKNPSLVIKVPAASLEAYKNAANWKDLADKIIKID